MTKTERFTAITLGNNDVVICERLLKAMSFETVRDRFLQHNSVIADLSKTYCTSSKCFSFNLVSYSLFEEKKLGSNTNDFSRDKILTGVIRDAFEGMYGSFSWGLRKLLLCICGVALLVKCYYCVMYREKKAKMERIIVLEH